MKKAFQIILFAVAAIFLTQINIFACKCESDPDFSKVFQDSDAVIKGEAIIVENFGMEIFALIKVEKSWKGIEEDKVIIKTDTGSCGVKFDVGEIYYLWVDKIDNSYVTMPCRNYGGEQITFLDQKPTLTLKSSTADFNSNLSKKEEKSPLTKTEEKKVKNEDPKDNLVFSYTLSVVGIVIFVLVLIVGYFFWKNRKL